MLMKTPPARWRDEAGRLQRWMAHPLAVPLLLAVMLFAIGAQVACVFKIPSWGNDEPAHIGYIATLAAGHLPEIDSPIMHDSGRFSTMAGSLIGWDTAHNDIWTANHPPAFHVLMVPVWWVASGDPGAAVVAMRLVNTLGFAAWLLLVGMIARDLVPRRPAVAALATVIAVAPTLAMRSGFLMNDGLGSAAALLLTLMTVRMLCDEITPRRVAVAALAGAVAAGTRAPGVLIVVACFAAVLIVGIRRHGWWRGLLAAGVVSGFPAAATGWFYLRNLGLYGDLTGQDALLVKFERSPVDSFQDILDLNPLRESVLTTPIPLLALLLLGPVVIVHAIRRNGLRPDPAWTLLVAHAALTVVNIGSFISAGGGFHDRYLMQVMPLVATMTALGMLEVGRWWRWTPDVEERRDWLVAAVWSAVLLVWLAGALWWLEQYYIFDRQDSYPAGGVAPAILVGVASLAGLAVLAAMVSRGLSVPTLPATGAQPLGRSDDQAIPALAD